MYSGILRWPTLGRTPVEEQSDNHDPAYAAFSTKDSLLALGYDETAVSLSFNHFANQIFGACATRLFFPEVREDLMVSSTRLRRSLPPSLRKRTKVIDRNGSKWESVRKYLWPIIIDFAPEVEIKQHHLEIEELAASLYLLILATEIQCEVEIPCKYLITACERLSAKPEASAEARARLALLRGVFQSASTLTELPTIIPRTGAQQFIRDQLDEMLDDSEFLEVSRLRQFFSISANKRALIRDMRLLIKALSRKKSWAGIITEGVINAATLVVESSLVSSGASKKLLEDLLTSAVSTQITITEQQLVLPENVSLATAVRGVFGRTAIFQTGNRQAIFFAGQPNS